ncbi:MAG: GntR family transcriptional regulator [Nocardiopsaceae bacterium]|nr:GntR family transcriptional regulator [Nocardiopsaceae bacterium]
MSSDDETPITFGDGDGDPRKWVQCANEIAWRIYVGTYKPGDVLPSVQRFAQEMGVTGYPAAQAYRELARIGLISYGYRHYVIGTVRAVNLPMREAGTVTVAQTASLLQVSKPHVYYMIRVGALKATGKPYRVYVASVERVLNNRGGSRSRRGEPGRN